MNSTKLLAVALAAACILIQTACSRKLIVAESSVVPSAAAPDLERSIKEAKPDALPAAKQLIQLRGFESKIGGAGEWVYPISLSTAENGAVYISDNNAHLIRHMQPGSTLISTLNLSHGGELTAPRTLQVWHDSIFVGDNDGLKVFKLDGSFQRLLRIFYQVNHFVVRSDGTIFINPAFRSQRASNPLIVQLDSSGKRLREFGTRLNAPGLIGLDDEAFLSASADYVIAAFRSRPIIRIFRGSGELLTEINVAHPIFGDLASLARNEKFVHPGPGKYRLPAYLAGVRIAGDRLVALLDLPQPEIVEFDFTGKEIARYRGSLIIPACGYRGFDAQRKGDEYTFQIIAFQADDSAGLFEFTSGPGG